MSVWWILGLILLFAVIAGCCLKRNGVFAHRKVSHTPQARDSAPYVLGNQPRLAYEGHLQFEAFCMCPVCHRWDAHKMREPVARATSPGKINIRTIRDGDDVFELRAWGLAGGPVDESPFTVIRQCDCGQEWGQR